MYLTKLDKKYLKQLILRDYFICCNTRILAYKENNLEYADELMYQEMYTKELLLKKFNVSESYLEDMKNKLCVGVTY